MSRTNKRNSRSHDTTALPWQSLEIKNLHLLDIDQVLSDVPIYDEYAIERALLNAEKSLGQQSGTTEVMGCLRAIAGMQSCPDDPNCPFIPAILLANGRRSAELSDFESITEFLTAAENVVKHLGLSSRLSHIIWVLNRERYTSAQKAANGYLSIVESMPKDQLSLGQIIFLSHAIHICNRTGKPKPLTDAVLTKISLLHGQIDMTTPLGIMSGLTSLTLNWNASDPSAIGDKLQAVATKLSTGQNSLKAAEVWGLCYRAFHKSKKDELAFTASVKRN